jgi:CxxC motif-containing protein (DUF1111 family)
MAQLETPIVVPPAAPDLFARFARGEAAFAQAGCAECHRGDLVLRESTWVERSDTTDGPGVTVELLRDGDAPRGSGRVRLFSDLKRHDMGASLAERVDAPSGVPARVFLTRPLWGLAESAPYLHDGRASTIVEAIRAHDGEARAARDAFAALPAESRIDLEIFLRSLSRAPRVEVPR